jgi:hypothetical protein
MKTTTSNLKQLTSKAATRRVYSIFVRETAAAVAASGPRAALYCFYFSESGAGRRLCATGIRYIDPARCIVGNNLNGYIDGWRGSFVNRSMYVSAAQIREALACSEGFKRAVIVINRERSLYDCDQTRAGMGVPPGLTARLEGVVGDIHIRVASNSCIEKPSRQIASTHQVEGARWEDAHGYRG